MVAFRHHALYGLRKAPIAPTGGAQDGDDAQFAAESGQPGHQIFFAEQGGAHPVEMFVTVDQGIQQAAALGGIFFRNRMAADHGKQFEELIGLADTDGKSNAVDRHAESLLQPGAGRLFFSGQHQHRTRCWRQLRQCCAAP